MSELVFKRKFRWTLEGKLPGGDLKPVFVKVGSFPRIKETQIEQSIIVTIWEKSLCEESPGEFWTTVYPSVCLDAAETPKLGTFKLTLYDGCGVAVEEWELESAYISKIDFAELDHSSSDESVVDMQICYENAKYKSLIEHFIF